MSNPLAAPTVTASLVTLVQVAVDTVGITPGPKVSAGSLADKGDHARVSVHLYRVSRHDSLSNEPLPVRSSDGRLRARPAVALDLHYLLCFRADSDLDAQSMLAVAAVAIEANPLLGPELLDLTQADHAEILGNDVRESPVPVRWTSDVLSVDELTKLWALYSAGEFALSLSVSAGPVIIEAAAVPSTGLPVRSIGIGARPFQPLRLDSVGGPDGPGSPVRAAAVMPSVELRGAGFLAGTGGTTVVLVDGVEVVPTTIEDALAIVPSAGLLPGTHRISVRRDGPPLDATVSTTPTTMTSETRALMVVPTLSAAVLAATRVTATVQPALSTPRRVRLLMDPVASGSAAGVPADPLPAGGSTAPTFDVTDVAAGTYRLTLEVDGVRSIPAVGPAGHYAGLEVTL